ncbi:YfbU family protein [Bacillus sp. IBL03825]|uniref:YfbU family protein n=1 Tax=Bacillus sp. IBL03825 TaxID=2953580 RepID=UPI0021572AA2|nr:YfbU family protein [Bacillus sp. IBL03825]MCR6850166.1 YfbU family protein [Bacillus sp. IBL03825]
MQLTKKERLALVNQYLILEKLYPNEEEYYKTMRIALEKGYTKHYSENIRFIEDELSEHQCEEVIEVLKMHRALNWSYDNLEDKEDVEKDDLKFDGFDLNDEHEAKYADYAKYYMHDLNFYVDVRAENDYETYNSHRSMLSKYRRMLSVWRGIENPNELTIQEIKDILNA